MAIATPSTVLATGSTGNLGTYDTAVATLTAGRLYLMVINGYRSGGGTAITSVTHDPLGTPLSFTLINDGTDNASVSPWDAASHRALHVYYVIPGSTTSSALIRIIWASTQSACGWRLIEVTSGFNATGGATTFPAVVVGTGTTSAVALTMPTAGATDNMTLLCMGWGLGTANPTETVAATESRSELGEHNDGERGSQGVHYQNPHGGDTSIGATLSANQNWGAIGIEVAAAETNITCSPGVGVLDATGLAPTAVINNIITAALGALDLTGLAASAIVGTVVTPALGTLDLTGFEPTVSVTNNITVTPALGALDLTGLEPTVSISNNQTVTPALGALDLAGLAPTVTASDHQIATADLGALDLAGLAPTVTVAVLVTPSVGVLDLTGLEPTVSVTAHVTVTPALGALDLTGLAPTVTGGEGLTVTPSTGRLDLAGLEPTVSTTNHQTITPALGELTLTGLAPTVTASDHQSVTAGLGVLDLAGFSPTITVAPAGVALAEPGVGVLTLGGFAPQVTVEESPLRPQLVTLWAWEHGHDSVRSRGFARG